MIFYIEKPEKIHTIRANKKAQQVTGYKIITVKLNCMSTHYTSNEQSEKEIKETILLSITPTNKFNERHERLYNKNYRTS